ncbi:hypothetical protein OS493_009441 [Desmophyllum pertusum]|uniref:Uncharacterized protein n=1 Tax=Desmophyllum pertusum TaxID=174260 RepID=A0A9W9Z5E6_9CNID|nr:hypothetical protein OS493_009441 [Desmophyllum pertusum]
MTSSGKETSAESDFEDDIVGEPDEEALSAERRALSSCKDVFSKGFCRRFRKFCRSFKRQWLADEKQMRFILWLYAVRNSGSLSRAQSQTYLVRRPPPFLPTTPNPTPTPELTNNVSSSEGNISFYIS